MSLAIVVSALAQTNNAGLAGTITDGSDAVVPHVRVAVKNTGTNPSQTTQTDGSSDYAFATLPPGDYSLTVEAPGFDKYVQNGIT